MTVDYVETYVAMPFIQNCELLSQPTYNAHCSRHSIVATTRCKSLKHTSPRPCSNRGRNSSFS